MKFIPQWLRLCPEIEFNFKLKQELLIIKRQWHENCAIKTHLCVMFLFQDFYATTPSWVAGWSHSEFFSSGRIHWRGWWTPHGSDLKPTEVNAKAHLFQEFADQFLHQQLTAIQTFLPLMGVAVENEMEVIKHLAVEDLIAMPEPAVLNSYKVCNSLYVLTITKAKQICRHYYSWIYSTFYCTAPPHRKGFCLYSDW